MKFCALVSGGKDSIYAIMEAVKNGHDLVCCAHLAPPPNVIESNSFMFQSAASSALPILVEECLGVPLVIRHASANRTAVNATSTYTNALEGDEVEDMYDLLVDVKKRFEDVSAISCGALFSNYQRVRVEHVCSRLDLTPISFLWRIPQNLLLDAMIEDGLHAVLVKVAAPGLLPRRHLNKDIGILRSHFHSLHKRFQFHVCGEGGEYESLVLDSPIFKKRLILDEVEIVFPDGDESCHIDEVAVLNILKCRAEIKENSDQSSTVYSMKRLSDILPSETKPVVSIKSCNSEIENPVEVTILPHGKVCAGGLLHLSGIVSSSPVSSTVSEGDAAVKEVLQIFKVVKAVLESLNMTPQDVIFVHLYLSRIAHFALINKYYKEFFGSVLPPSRSCVAIGEGVLPGDRRVLLDLCAQSGSSNAMRKGVGNTFHNRLREVLHVQGISYWAPVCVGPYSQLNAIRGGMLMLAGQIGLDPPTMQLRDGWKAQLNQAWKNAASVLDAFSEGRGGRLNHCMGALVYLSKSILFEDKSAIHEAEQLSLEAIANNGGINPGFIDGYSESKAELYDGYEDEETAAEVEKSAEQAINIEQERIPIIVVVIPEMPMGALSEVELVCISNKAYNNIGISTVELETTTINSGAVNIMGGYASSQVNWDCGYKNSNDSQRELSIKKHDINIHGNIRFSRNSCGVALIYATFKQSFSRSNVNSESIMNAIASKVYDSIRRIGLSKDDILHVRLYYNRDIINDGGGNISSAMRVSFKDSNASCSVIPVCLSSSTIFAAQVMICNLEHMETEMWIDQTRDYSS